MLMQARLFGLNNSNRDFSKTDAWGKNQFNSSFPAALSCYLDHQEMAANYIVILNQKFSINVIDVANVFGIKSNASNLYFAFEAQYTPFQKYVIGILPKWFVMENVQRITKSSIFTEISKQFTKCGYGLSSVVLDASHCHVPQSRLRFFLVGELGGKQNNLVDLFKVNLANKPMTIRDYLGDKLNLQYYYRHPRSYARRGIFSIDEPSPTIRGVNRPMPPNYQLHSGDPQDIDISSIRPLTTIERSYIQTFPESFKFFGTKTNLEQIIGNAVPVNLAFFVASTILKYVKKEIDIHDLSI
ncbi:MAG: HindVP family restriction endonuclease [Coleofasciculaceae cyanobacterium SM2_1_6]|nr:HindVP family restriction endonuclease [Coleofasciculaceae cyanobacterium SM2_1_6]